MNSSRIGQVYLLHFERKIGNPASPRGQAQHYLGWAYNLDARLAQHRNGSGSKLVAAMLAQGIDFVVAQTWSGDRMLEQRLKGWKKARQLCPVCRGDM